MPEKIGVIDIGTNSVKVCVARLSGGMVQYEAEYAIITRLGKGFHEGILLDESIERTVSAVMELAEFARKRGSPRVIAVGTEALRNAENRDEFAARIRGTVDEFAVITGDFEAMLSVAGAIGSRTGLFTCMEIGGGSVQFSSVLDGKVLATKSRKIGVVSLYEKFVTCDPPTSEEISAMAAFIESELKSLTIDPIPRLLLIGGTARTIARIVYPVSDSLDGVCITIEVLKEFIERLNSMTNEQRISQMNIEPGRADVMVAGAQLVLCACIVLTKPEFEVAARALRHGLARLLLTFPAGTSSALQQQSTYKTY